MEGGYTGWMGAGCWTEMSGGGERPGCPGGVGGRLGLVESMITMVQKEVLGA